MTKMFFVLFSLTMTTMVMDAESSLYNFSWLDKDKEIYVLQNRKFRKDGQVYIGGNAGKTLSGAFIDAYGVSGRAGYFFREDWGIELMYGKSMGNENNTAKGIRDQGTVPFYRKIDTNIGAMVMWSPFYSKINTFNKIFYYDWLFGAGLTNITTKDNRARFVNQNDGHLTSETSMGILWTTGMRFYIDQHWSFRLDFTGMNWQADRYGKPQTSGQIQKKKDWFNNYDVALGLNYGF
jgi:outer membrane beta-barrel protein